MAKVIQRRSLNVLERSYLVEIIKGMGTTFKHLVKNFRNPENMQLMSYPEIEVKAPRNYRGSHRLMKRPDGEPRCVACYMCSTACPARCITIEAGSSSDPRIEKKPVKFEIDWLVCVFCGLCEEACPVDAIRMDTRKVAISNYRREDFVATMETLLNWDPKDYPANDAQSQRAPGGSLNQEAMKIWGLEVKQP
jgi:NADH-quinone oxidoreductase subunit I